MKAVVVRAFGSEEVLRVEEAPDLSPGPGEVTVDIRAAGVNPVETYIRSGAYARKPELPYTPGTDGAGIVRAIGAGVTRVSAGLRVYLAGSITGTYAGTARARVDQVFPLPDTRTFSEGAGLHVPYATAYRALLDKAGLRSGETVLIRGASGGVGLAAIQIARMGGAIVYGTAGTGAGSELARKAGAVGVFGHDEEDKIRAAIGGAGPNVIVTMLGNATLDRDLALAAPFGRIVVVGSRGRVEIDPRPSITKDLTVHGLSLWNATPDEVVRIHRVLSPGLAAGTLRPVVRCELPLAEAPRAHRMVLAPGAAGKIVLLP